jgi:hypothetical protein
MASIYLLKLGLIALAVACFVFGGLTARKGFQLERGRHGNSAQDQASEQFGAEALVLGAFVFFFGFGLLYMLSLF